MQGIICDFCIAHSTLTAALKVRNTRLRYAGYKSNTAMLRGRTKEVVQVGDRVVWPFSIHHRRQ